MRKEIKIEEDYTVDLWTKVRLTNLSIDVCEITGRIKDYIKVRGDVRGLYQPEKREHINRAIYNSILANLPKTYGQPFLILGESMGRIHGEFQITSPVGYYYY